MPSISITPANNNGPDVKDRIFAVAKELFVKNGYKSTSVREIASLSGTNVAMVSYYFGSKYNLFQSVFQNAFDILWQRIFETITSEKDFFELIEDWVNTYYYTLLEFPQLPEFLLNEVSLDPQKLTHPVLAKQPYKLFLKISQRIEQEAANGVIRNIPPLDLMLNIMSLCIFPFIFRRLAAPVANVSQQTYDAMLEGHRKEVLAFVIAGLRPTEK